MENQKSNEMTTTQPRRSVQRRGRQLMVIGALVLMSGVLVAALGFVISLIFGSGFFGSLIIVFGGLVFLAGIGLMIRGVTLRKDNEEADSVAGILKVVLDARYTLVGNVKQRGLNYIDAVLVGPPGALVMRVSKQSGTFRNEDLDWLESRNGKPPILSGHKFSLECLQDVLSLREYLGKHGLTSIPVYGIVIFINPDVQLSASNPRIPFADIRTLLPVMREDFLREDRIPQQVCEAAVQLLSA